MIKVRNSSIELLRILAMLMIVIHHFNIHGIFLTYPVINPSDINLYLSSIFAIGGKIGVQIFILISGYFMINANSKYKSLFNIYLKTVFYSLLFLIISFIYGSHHVSSNPLNCSLFPFCSFSNWFVAAYLVLQIVSPFLNFIIKEIHTNKKKYAPIGIFFFVIVFVLPSIFNVGYPTDEFSCFFCLYSIGAFIRLKTFKILTDSKLLKKCCFVSLFTLIVFIIVSLKCEPECLLKTHRLLSNNSLFALAISVYLVNLFLNIQIKHNKIINWISASTFGVYLIHDNVIVRPFLWRVLFPAKEYLYTDFFLAKMLLVSVFVYIACVIFDKFASFVYQPIIDFVINKTKVLFPEKAENKI